VSQHLLMPLLTASYDVAPFPNSSTKPPAMNIIIMLLTDSFIPLKIEFKVLFLL